MKKFLIPPSTAEIENAFIQAFLIIEDCEKKDILLITPTKNQMHTTSLKELLGDENVKDLIKKVNIQVKGISIRLESLKTFKISDPRNSVIIGIHSGKSILDKMDDSNANAIIAVPSVINEIVQNWIDTWNPEVYGEEKTDDEKILINNCVVEKALKTITSLMKRPQTSQIIIKSTLDKEMTVELFKVLRKYNELYDPESIRKWAIRKGWTSKGADELKDISKKILEGKRIRGSKIPIWTEENIKTWRDECD